LIETTELFRIRNLSRGGALAETTIPLSADSFRRARLVVGDYVNEIEVRIRHVRPTRGPTGEERYLVGLEFENLHPSVLEHIDHVMAVRGSSDEPGQGGRA
jgi:hypothetical protein